MTDDTRKKIREILEKLAKQCWEHDTPFDYEVDYALSEIEKLVDGEVDNGIRLGAVSAIGMDNSGRTVCKRCSEVYQPIIKKLEEQNTDLHQTCDNHENRIVILEAENASLKRSAMIHKLLCFIGWHEWEYCWELSINSSPWHIGVQNFECKHCGRIK